MASKLRSALKLLVPVIVVGFGLELWHLLALPRSIDSQQTWVLGSNRFFPGTEASLRLLVRNVGRNEPVEGAAAKVSLRADLGDVGALLFEGTSDATGNVPVTFRVPADASGEHRLVIEVESDAGRDRIERRIQIEPALRLAFGTDKPLYRPGETVHMRALAFRSFDVAPARDATMSFLVRDPEGNRVFHKRVNASEVGIGAADFELEQTAVHGEYEISASLDEKTCVATTIEVHPRVHPRFHVRLSTDRNLYAPGERVEGTIEVKDFTGEPVARARVELEALRYDGERMAIVGGETRTNAMGSLRFGFDLPPGRASDIAARESGELRLEATVVDDEERAERAVAVLFVSAQPIVIQAVTEIGPSWLFPRGVEREVYIYTTYPDGSPARTEVEIEADFDVHRSLVTSSLGTAVLRIEPPGNKFELFIQASDRRSATARRSVSFDGSHRPVVLRTDRAVYFAGETMHLTVDRGPGGFDGTAYVDFVKEGQTVATYSTQGRELTVDVRPDWYGTMDVHAYTVAPERGVVGDHRLIVVDGRNDLEERVEASKDTFRGEATAIDLRTSAPDDTPVQLGLSIVDQSVITAKGWTPEAAKLFFLLDSRLLPQVQKVKGFHWPSNDAGGEVERTVQDAIAKDLWTGLPASGLALRVNAYDEKKKAIAEAQTRGLAFLAFLVLLGLTFTLIGAWRTVISDLRGSGVVLRVVAGTANWCGLMVLATGGFFLFFGEIAPEVPSEILLFHPAAFVAASVSLALYAKKRRDETLRALSWWNGSWIACCFLFLFLAIAGESWVSRFAEISRPFDTLMVLFVVLGAGIALAFMVHGQKQWAESRRAAGWLAVLTGSLPLLLLLGVPLAEFADGLSNRLILYN